MRIVDELEAVHSNLDYIHKTLEEAGSIDDEAWKLLEPKIVKSWVLLEEIKKSIGSQ
ncbi:hypothetical protein [Bacillus sp. MZGC1]|uniref:hypothetical protein n=1 Tax=Bacillus sp. MZGC1 TaxID=2108543 RepID=UPI00166F6CFD|nr:hypothetical protein [Bacillus sp. MZGC1]